MRASLAYLVSRYPAISHTFILREVVELRRLGFRIDVASINAPDRPAGELTAEEGAETKAAFYVKSRGISGAFRAHARVLVTMPAEYLRGLWFALRLGGADLRKIVMASFYFAEAVMVGDWMRSLGLGHLHIHFATPAATVGLIVNRVFGFTISITVHGPDEFYDAPGYLLREKISAASLLCAIGLFARSQLMKFSDPSLWPKIQLTPLGVDVDVFAPRRPARQDGETFEVICVGRLTPAKGQHVLLAAISHLRAEGRRVRLRLIGDGPDRESLTAAALRLGIEDRVTFEGAINQDRIRDFYEEADVFALASFAEGIPVVLMEAMAMEIPCVSTWVAGIPELIRDSMDGLLVPPSDEAALAGAIARLMDDRELRRELGRSGRRRVMEKYCLRRNVSRLAEVFETQLETRKLGAAA